MTTETRIFSTNLENFSSRLNASLEKAVAEAVVNSLHAYASKICVTVKTFKDGGIDFIEIVDNGDGFTQENINSWVMTRLRTH